MTGHSTDIDALRKRAITGWKSLGSPVPLLFDNNRADAKMPASFIRFSVRPGTEEQRSLGNSRVRVNREGRVWLQVAIPIGNPDSEAWALVDQAKSLFVRWRAADLNLRCWEADTRVVPDTKHYIVAVCIRYTSDRAETA
ncbi:phage tail terminator-like protein [Sphingomonas sp. Ag1]|jgi:hypothetical protein|uniref:phage tail terminator-like protein n=1 Tax=Sphingomonas sp. Ag1 TaxID=1642949 RepID=UPI000620E50D|nr:phage tail terminator-like protein [Sphingomonas sp. Ag1]KKI22331.1 hypothetical protein XM50_00775 [Sphingomonas sp. Ag1]